MKEEREGMSKYKIIQTHRGFSVWTLKDFGAGYFYEDSGRIFRTLKDAQHFADIYCGRRASSNDDKKRENE